MKILPSVFGRAVAVDAVMVVALLAGYVPLLLDDPDLGSFDSGQVNAVLFVMGTLPLLVRRQAPVVVAWLTLLAGGLSTAAGLYTAASRTRSRLMLVALTLGALMRLSDPKDDRWLEPGSWVDWLGAAQDPLLYTSVALLLGLYARTRSDLIIELAARAERLKAEQRLLAERAAQAERDRLAREMHDVVAHRISLVVLHAGALETAGSHDPVQVRRTVELIRAAGREALDELRVVLAVLRKPGEPAEAEQPSIADLDRLIAQSQAAGTPVEVHVEGVPRELPGPVQRTVYRIVQESLTNVHKHARGAPVDMLLRYRATGVEVAVSNPVPRSRRSGSGSGSYGLTGMRERVSALGGTFEAGAGLDERFGVAAWLPTTEASR